MSIANEIARLQGAKADLKTAIEGKGVTVPAATKLDGYADLVDDIQAGGEEINNQDKSVTPTEAQQSVTADAGYTGLGTVTVGAIDSNYVGSNVPRRGVNDLTAWGAFVNAPSGYYPDGVSKSVQIITGAKPTAEKGTVSNHGVWVTPSITYAEGYIQAGTKSGTAVRVEASELVSGTKQISANGSDIDVTDYESVDVAVPNSYTASDEGKVVSNGALVSQSSATYTANDTYDTTLIDEVTVNVSGSGGISVDDIAQNLQPSGVVTLSNSVTSIGDYAFAGKPITSITAPSVTSIGVNAFQSTQIASITDANFPSYGVNTQGNISLAMNSLVSIKMTGSRISLSTYGQFQNKIPNCVTAEFPNCAKDLTNKDTNSATFYGNGNLEVVDFGYSSGVGSLAFYNCRNIRTLIFRSESVASLNAWNVNTLGGIFSNPTESTIYVPQSLISSYQTATNWSAGYAQGLTFAKIEGSQYAV